jgi:hypothetical protein
VPSPTRSQTHQLSSGDLAVVLGRDRLARCSCPDDPPRVPGDFHDHDGDREADQRVSAVEADRDEESARDHAERDEAVGAGVLAVGDQGRAAEPAASAQRFSYSSGACPPPNTILTPYGSSAFACLTAASRSSSLANS